VEEQVYLPTPVRGAYTIRVRGLNVPMGPQPFAVVASGAGGVSSQGLIGLDRTRYGAATTVQLKVGDRDLNASATAPDEVLVTIRSDADPGGETVRLVETGADTSVFVGALPTASAPGVDGDGLLAVSEGDAILATYLDADDGTGAPATATAAAVGDLTAPGISGVSVVEVGQDFARVALAATEPVTAKVLYGPGPELGGESAVRWLAGAHDLRLGALEEGVEYLFTVQVTDEAGNVATDALRSLTTLVLPPSLEVHSTRGELTNAHETVLFGKTLDPSGVASLTLDGAAVSVRPADGYFEAAVPLAIGENRFTLVASDALGQQATRIVIVTRVPVPDLTVRDVTAPELVGIGMPFVAGAEVCNLGPGEIWSDSVTVIWYLWDEAASRGYLLKNRELWAQPPPGTCTPVSDPLTANSLAFLAGAYRVGVTVFSGDPEERDDNNDALSPAAIRFAPPDLVPTTLDAPAEVRTARAFDVETTIENRGPGKAVAVGVNLYLSDDDVITSTDRLVATFQIDVLAGGSSVSTTTAVTLPTDVAEGSYRMGVVVDGGARIVEGDDANNVLAGGVVTVVGPDLEAVSVEGPPAARTGDVVTFHDVVTAAADGGDVGPFTVGLYAARVPQVTVTDVKLGERAVASLAAGASSEADVTVSIPATFAPGSWWVAAIADPGGRVRETDEANNLAPPVALVVTGPDLALTTASAPGTAVVGGTIVLEETVAAAADGGAAPAVDVLYYLSADEAITGADLVLGWRSVPALAPGGSSSATTTLTVPVGLAPGPYYVGLVVDDFAYCYEDEWETQYCLGGDVAKEPGDGSNNVRVVGPVAVAGTDLRVTSLSAIGTPATGRPLVVRDSVVAAGGGAGGFRVGYYLSADAVVTTADTLLGSRLVAALPPDGESSGEVTVTLPVGLAPGAYTLGAIADHQRWVAEVDEANNAFAGPVALVAGPDLVAGAPEGPQTLARSVAASFTTTVSNVGAGTSPNALVWICLSADASVTTTDRVIGSRLVPGLAPGASSAAPVTLTIPSDVAPGSYYLGAIVDPGNAVKEEIEANNASASTPLAVVQ
jgi:subtilase family serine protease